MNTPRPRWSAQTKLIVTLLLLGLLAFLLSRFSTVIPPLIIAFILAFILTPLATFFQERLRIPRTLATLLAYFIVIIALLGVLALIIPTLANQSSGLNLDIQELISQAEVLLGHQFTIAGQVIDGAAIIEQLVGSVQSLLQPIFEQTLGIAVEVISSIAMMVFIFIISFYLIKDSKALRKWMEGLPPPEYKEDFIQLRNEINMIWSAFFRGQLILGLVVAIILSIVGLIIGLPFALAMGLLAGLLEFLPSIGHAIWLTIASILAFFVGSTWLPLPNWIFLLMLIGLHIIFQQFDLNYLIPRIIGRRVHLPPLVVILGIVAGATFAGVMGIVLAAPTIASARVIGRYVFANLFETEPFPEETTVSLPPPDPRWWDLRKYRRKARTQQEDES